MTSFFCLNKRFEQTKNRIGIQKGTIQVEYAAINSETLEKIKKTEREIRDQSRVDVVLIAYKKEK